MLAQVDVVPHSREEHVNDLEFGIQIQLFIVVPLKDIKEINYL
jgi:hypothetical protein